MGHVASIGYIQSIQKDTQQFETCATME